LEWRISAAHSCCKVYILEAITDFPHWNGEFRQRILDFIDLLLRISIGCGGNASGYGE